MENKSLNSNFHAAKKAKKDEFYTQLTDIEKELWHYRHHFKDKVVYCNCDDPRVSKFFHYFSYNFEKFGLKKLITTCYKSDNPDLFSNNASERAIYIEYKADANGKLIPYPQYMQSIKQECLYTNPSNNPYIPQPNDIGIGYLQGDGDFRSDECIAFLKQADIVVTNPPFSLFREYIAQLIKYDKQFVILGNLNAISYKEIFDLIKANQLWLGPSITSGDREFGVPDSYPLNAAGYRIDEEGNKFIRVKGVRWYTNLDHNRRHEKLILYKHYSPQDYQTYDNYNAIEVSETKLIPMDYAGVMGLPITFLDKYNPEQFEIIGSDYQVKEGLLPHIVNPTWTGKLDRGYIKGNRKYSRLLIKHKNVST